jgi:transcriptional regulator with XRE-family HTH domain
VSHPDKPAMMGVGHPLEMATRRRPIDIGAARARDLTSASVREILATRLNAGLSQEAVATTAGMSRSRYGRIERGGDRDLSIDELARIGAVLGLELSVRFFPIGDPLRDAGQRAVLERFRIGCHPSLSLRTEVPFPIPGDLRAWDAVVSGFASAIRCGVEVETRPTDEQALARKLAVKRRDGRVDRLILVLPDTRHNRAFLRSVNGLRAAFPVTGRRAMELLRAGVDPGGDAIVLR